MSDISNTSKSRANVDVEARISKRSVHGKVTCDQWEHLIMVLYSQDPKIHCKSIR